MKKIQTSDLQQGMYIAEDIYSNGVLIIAKGLKLRSEHVYYLRYESDYNYIRIYESDDEDDGIRGKAKVEKVNFDGKYKEAVNSVKDIFLSTRFGGKLIYDEIEEIVDIFIEELDNNFDMSYKIWQIYNSDDYTFEHSVQVSIYVMLCGHWLGMSIDEIKELSTAGLLLDLGKCNVPDDILNKPDVLTEEEFKVIRTHPTIGYMLLSNTNKYSSAILCGVLQHHERRDGSGYPYGLIEDDIHPYARLIAIADVYAAMTSDRAYAKAESPFFVIGKLHNRECGGLDPFYTKVFVENMISHFLGTKVRLSNGKIGKIIFVEKLYPDKPIVETDEGLINLSENQDIFIEHIYKDDEKIS